ncbi:MAG: YicC family protein [Planctomycetota bacterium]|nr:YicC family protein [Planctomycetota bacterium]
MPLSMTGHGQASHRFGEFSIDVEIRTVNNRFLKVSTKVSELSLSIEPELESIVREYLKRGTVSLSVRVVSRGGYPSKLVNQSMLSAYIREAKIAAESTNTPFIADFANLLSLPGVLEPQSSTDLPELNEAIRETVRDALKDLHQMRSIEGLSMKSKFIENLKQVREHRHSILQRAPVVISDYQSKLESRVRVAYESRGIGLETVDLLREVTLFCDKTDISEELTRLESHLDQFEKAIESEESQGRRLDFLVQELGRETNTIGSKANDAELSYHVVAIKTILEQIRELVQNVE